MKTRKNHFCFNAFRSFPWQLFEKQNISNWTRRLKLQLQIQLVNQCLRNIYENVFFCHKALYQTFYFGKVHREGVCF